MLGSAIELLGGMRKNALQVGNVQFLACLAISGSRGRRHSQGFACSECLDLAHYLLAASIGIQHLGEERPKGIGFAEQPPSAE